MTQSSAISAVAAASRPASSDATASRNNSKLKTAAKQFEAMFLGEMLRLARPPDNAAGPFAQGNGEKTWQIFMDQALGQAMSDQGGFGLAKEIEDAMQKAQGPQAKETK